MEMPAAICNGCGNESSAWDQLCTNCSQEIICQNCKRKYKRGQGLQDVDLCATCVRELLETTEEEEFEREVHTESKVNPECDPYSDYGFDHQWELYEK